jgi:hypothetical protein
VDARRDFLVAGGILGGSELVLADPAELGDDGAQRRVAPEQRRYPDGVRGELVEACVQLPLAAVAPEVAPFVRAPRPHKISIASPNE